MKNFYHRMMLICILVTLISLVWAGVQPPGYSELDLHFMKADLITICVVRMDIELEKCWEMFDDIIDHIPDETWNCYKPYKDDWTDYRNGMRIIQCIMEAME